MHAGFVGVNMSSWACLERAGQLCRTTQAQFGMRCAMHAGSGRADMSRSGAADNYAQCAMKCAMHAGSGSVDLSSRVCLEQQDNYAEQHTHSVI